MSKDQIKPPLKSMVTGLTGTTAALPEGPQRVPKVIMSGHMADQILTTKNHEKEQLNLLDLLSPEKKAKINGLDVKIKGIDLSVKEERLVNTLLILLKKHSENKDSKSEDYYQGNSKKNDLIRWGKNQVSIAKIQIDHAEIYKSYLGNKDYSGREMKDIDETIKALSEKQFTMTYDRTEKVKGKKGQSLTDRLIDHSPLFRYQEIIVGLSDKEKDQLDRGDSKVKKKKGSLIISFHPIFTDQIDSKWIAIPEDINQRTIEAVGGNHRKVTQAINQLKLYLLRVKSSGHLKHEIGYSKLINTLRLDKMAEEGRRSVVSKRLEDAIGACKGMGLIDSYEEGVSVEGEKKYIFQLNKDFV